MKIDNRLRLTSDNTQTRLNKFPGLDLMILILICVMTFFLIRLPSFSHIYYNEKYFYERKNISIIVFFGLTVWKIWVSRFFDRKSLGLIAGVFIVPLIYINLLPNSVEIDLPFDYLPFMMWYIYGLVYIKFNFVDKAHRIEYIKYSGDLIIFTSIVIIVMSVISIPIAVLFSIFNGEISSKGIEFIIDFGLITSLFVANYAIQNYPLLINKIAPIIANVLSPLVLIASVVYVITILSPSYYINIHNDEGILIGTMAFIGYAASRISNHKKHNFNKMILFILSLVLLIIDIVALTVLLYRIFGGGIVSPSLFAILGINLLVFGNLLLIIIDLFKVNTGIAEIDKVKLTTAKYLPLYMIWILFVEFGFPFIFGMS